MFAYPRGLAIAFKRALEKGTRHRRTWPGSSICVRMEARESRTRRGRCFGLTTFS